MAQPVITIAAAEPITQDDPVIDVTIRIEGRPPRHADLRDAEAWYAQEARTLSKALVDSLPGGTLHALLVELLKHKVSLLAVKA